MAWEANNDHRMKLFTGQNEDNDPNEEGGERGMATLKEREEESCCPSEHKYLFGILVDKQIMKFSTSPRMGSSNISKNRLHRAGTRWLHVQKQPTIRMKEERKLKTMDDRNELVACTGAARYRDEDNREAKMKDDKGVKEEEGARRKRSKETFPPLDAAISGMGGGVPT